VVGPDASAARIESSKSFAKDVMLRAGVPTARWQTFERYEDALRHLESAVYPLVVKADGLAAGKGVVLCAGPEAARNVVTTMMIEDVHGPAGRTILVEEVLVGREVSLLAFVDGTDVATLDARPRVQAPLTLSETWTCPVDTSTTPRAQTSIGFTHESSRWLLIRETCSRSWKTAEPSSRIATPPASSATFFPSSVVTTMSRCPAWSLAKAILP